MKTRYGFVSNSSSTSFYVAENQKQRAEECGLELVAVSDILFALKAIEPVEFLVGYGDVLNTIERLEKIEGGYITAPYDRDWAYKMGYDVEFGTFESDL